MRRLILATATMLLAWSPFSHAEVSQRDGVRVSVTGKIAPNRLPRTGTAPVAVSIAGRIGATKAADPPQLRTISIAINSHGHLTTRGIPLCRLGHISPSTTEEARASCGRSLVGEGRFSANVKLPEQSPFPSEGKVLAFNGRLRGMPAILAHIYGTHPVPTSYVLPFLIRRAHHGTFATTLEASLPQVTGDWGYVTGVSMRLERIFTSHGKRRSYSPPPAPPRRASPAPSFPSCARALPSRGASP